MEQLIFLNENFRRETEDTLRELIKKYSFGEKEIKEKGRKIKAYYVHCSMRGVYFVDPFFTEQIIVRRPYFADDELYLRLTGDDELSVDAVELYKGEEKQLTEDTKRTAPMRLRVRSDQGYCKTVDVSGWNNLVKEANRLLEEVFKYYMLEWEEGEVWEYAWRYYDKDGFATEWDLSSENIEDLGRSLMYEVQEYFDRHHVILSENIEPEYC